ncbi:carbohydrate ABC transporter permease [Pedococcus sp. 5OH_020]|uniref:carbohydrate ABC transporter permease n=1 Tax=Pedococcus sp. 5OH_020 TaxID=2989814 RepID=UPI0022EA013D|nr:carbohydrate ABC transporter permease [Pedococcus sp. 5OH_020]
MTTDPTATIPKARQRRGNAIPANRGPGLRQAIGKWLIWLALAILAVLVIYPLLWMVFSSFKDNGEVFGHPFGLPGQLRWHNFVEAGNAGVVRYFTNSVIVTAGSILTTTLFSAWAAYGLVRLNIPFGGPVVLLLLGGLMLAPTVALIPLFGLLQQLHIYNTLWALLVLYTAFRIPFTTFLIRAYMIDLPPDVDEAAILDGASRSQIFWQIILPMCRPILVSAALLQALFAWNEFVFALVFLSDSNLKTLPVGLMDMQSRLLTNWPVQFAGLTMAALPMLVLFLIGQRQFLRGLTEGMGK